MTYLAALDRRDLDSWLSCFADEAGYVCITRENHDAGLPVALMLDDTRARLKDRVKFINDSKATNADAARQAMATYPRFYWIAGGRPKEGGIDSLSDLFPRIAKAYLIGEAAQAFGKVLKSHCPVAQSGTIAAATTAAFDDAAATDEDAVILLSPACASFDQFADFEERGEAFRDVVSNLARADADAEVSA